MPSRVFNQLDVTGIVEGYLAGPTTTNFTVFNFTNTNFGNWQFVASGVHSGVGPNGMQLIFTYQKVGTLNFQPLSRPLPDDALITRVKIRTPVSISGSADASSAISGGVQVKLDCSVPLVSTIPPNILFAETINEILSASGDWNRSFLGSDADVIYDYSSNPIDIATLILNHGTQTLKITVNEMNALCGTNIDPAAANNASLNIEISNWFVEVTYEQKYSWIVSQDPLVPIDVGSTVTLKSPESVTLPLITVDFTKVTQIDILVPDPSNPGLFITFNVPLINWTLITANLLTFIMPDWAPYTPTVVYVQLTSSTQFSGSVAKQLYTILFVSASGIYQLIPGKTSDTLYIEDEPGETIDVKIPDPYGKTGFFAK